MTAPRETISGANEEAVQQLNLINRVVTNGAPFQNLLQFLRKQENNTKTKDTPTYKLNGAGTRIQVPLPPKPSESFEKALIEEIKKNIHAKTVQSGAILDLPEDGSVFFISSSPGTLSPIAGTENTLIDTSWEIPVHPGQCIGIPGNIAEKRAFRLKNTSENSMNGWLVNGNVQDLIAKAGVAAKLPKEQIDNLQTLVREYVLETGVKSLQEINRIRKNTQRAAIEVIHPDHGAIQNFLKKKGQAVESGELRGLTYITGKAVLKDPNVNVIATIEDNFIGHSGLLHVNNNPIAQYQTPPRGWTFTLEDGASAHLIEMNQLSKEEQATLQTQGIQGLWTTLRAQYAAIAQESLEKEVQQETPVETTGNDATKKSLQPQTPAGESGWAAFTQGVRKWFLNLS